MTSHIHITEVAPIRNFGVSDLGKTGKSCPLMGHNKWTFLVEGGMPKEQCGYTR